MKTTKIMLACIVVYLLTWVFLAGIGWLLSDVGFKACMTHELTIMIQFVLGWIPATIVGIDLVEKL